MAARLNWTPEILAQVGKMPDAEIAALLGCTVSNVRKKRQALRMPSASRQQIKWGPREVSKLGTMPDKDLAAKLGCARGAVLEARLYRGIHASNIQGFGMKRPGLFLERCQTSV